MISVQSEVVEVLKKHPYARPLSDLPKMSRPCIRKPGFTFFKWHAHLNCSTYLLRSTLLFSPCSIYSLVLFACSLARSLIYGKGWSSSRRRTLDVIPIMMQVKQGSYGTLCVIVLPSVHPSVCLCIHPSVCPSVRLPMFVCVTWHYRPKVSKDDDACEPRYYNTTHKWSGAGRAV